jgi:Raf kinase inhibitor-like YbhB/YbcL family protein
MTFTLTSSAFTDQGEIPVKYTCQGADLSPPLQWSGAPDGTKSFVLIIDDPDAPDPNAPKMTWVHWVLFNLPADVSALPEGIGADDLPASAISGQNDWKRSGYGGPCPPIGRHRYFHKLYAIDAALVLSETGTKSDVEAAMVGHVLAQATLMGTYVKTD